MFREANDFLFFLLLLLFLKARNVRLTKKTRWENGQIPKAKGNDEYILAQATSSHHYGTGIWTTDKNWNSNNLFFAKTIILFFQRESRSITNQSLINKMIRQCINQHKFIGTDWGEKRWFHGHIIPLKWYQYFWRLSAQLFFIPWRINPYVLRRL